MYSSQSTAAQNFAYTAAALGEQTYQWASQTYAADTAMTQESVANYLQMSQLGLGLANENLADYNNIYRPEMAQLANEAGSYSSAARQEVNAGAAEAQSEAGSQAGLSQAQQQLQAYGINPNSGMYAELLASQQTGAGAAAAGAGQEASLATQNVGRQLLQASLQQGDQLPAAAVNALNSAYQGVSGAENATLANANTGANLFQVPNSYFQTAMQLKYPPVGNVQQATQGSSSISTPNNNKPTAGGRGGYQPSQPAQAKPTPSTPSTPGGGGGGGGSKGIGGGNQGSGNAQILNVPQDNNNGYTYSPYDPSNPYSMVSPDSTGLQPFGGVGQASQFYDPYSTAGTGDVFNPSQNNPGFNTQGLQTGTATIGPQSYSATPYLGTPGSPGGGGPGAVPTFNSGASGIPSTPTPGGGFGGGVTDNGGTGADTWANVSNFNPISTANADTFNSDPYQPYTQDQANGGNYSGGIQPIQENAPPVEEQAPAPQQDNSEDYNSGDYSAPPPPQQDNTGGYGGYAAGGQVGMMKRSAIPMRPSPGKAMQMRMPMPSRGPGLARGGIPMPVSRNIPATRMGGFHSNAPSLRSLASGGPTTGGNVPRSASPSNGRQTDDIPARLNAEEFVIPRDATKYYGHKFFLDLIKKARAATGQPDTPARPTMKPMSQSQVAHPRFVSRPMGQ